MRRIYFDNAATTPIEKSVWKCMKPFFVSIYGNPSSAHNEGRRAHFYVESSRNNIAELLKCKPEEIFFTSGASESNSWISKNLCYWCDPWSHDSMKMANKKNDAKVKAHSFPLVDSEMGQKTKFSDKDFFVHLDLTQAIGKVDIDLSNSLIGSASFSAHKFGGPKGVGVLYINSLLQKRIEPLIYGHQERGLRGGTENVPGIVGMAEALRLAIENKDKNIAKIKKVRDAILSGISRNNKIEVYSSSNIINIKFKHLKAYSAVQIFNQYGIDISAGSACNSGSDEPSESLTSRGFTEDEALRTIRISLSHHNTVREAKKFCKILNRIIDTYDKE